MGIMIHSLLWVMQDLYHQPYVTRKYTLTGTFTPVGSSSRGEGSVSMVCVRILEGLEP